MRGLQKKRCFSLWPAGLLFSFRGENLAVALIQRRKKNNQKELRSSTPSKGLKPSSLPVVSARIRATIQWRKTPLPSRQAHRLHRRGAGLSARISRGVSGFRDEQWLRRELAWGTQTEDPRRRRATGKQTAAPRGALSAAHPLRPQLLSVIQGTKSATRLQLPHPRCSKML